MKIPVTSRFPLKIILDHYKRRTPCIDCGNNYPAECMEFDHLPQFKKEVNISRLCHDGNVGRLRVELKKCQLVCANCHRVRTRLRRIEATARVTDIEF